MQADGYCHFGRDNEPLAMAYRKEYRMMTGNAVDLFIYKVQVKGNWRDV